MHDIAALLKKTDTNDRAQIYLTWNELGAYRQEIVPHVARAFAETKEARGRESQLYYVTQYARFDDHAIDLGLTALRDRKKEVRYRACGLLAHSQRRDAEPALEAIERGPSREAAQRALRSLREGKPFGADDDPFYFIHGHEPYRAPRGSFADAMYDAISDCLENKGFRRTQHFQHRLEMRDGKRVAAFTWDSYDVGAHASLGDKTIDERGGPNDIAALAEKMRALVSVSR